MLISFLRGKDNCELFLGNRRVLKIAEGKKYWKKVFTEAKSGGAKKLRLRTADNVVGLSEREISKGGLEKLIVVPIILNHRVKLNFPTES